MIITQRVFAVLFAVLTAHAAITQVNAGKPDIARIYDEGERLYRGANYAGSLDYLKKEAKDWLGISDTLMYLKIKNLDNLYRSNFEHTKDLEATLQRFLQRVNKNTFPELKYSEVTSVFTSFQSFKEKDKTFFDSVTNVYDLTKTASLAPLRNVTSNYLKAVPNTYYSTQLAGYISSIDNKIAQLEAARKKHEKDSLNRAALKKVGKTLVMNFSYSVPSGGKQVFAGLDNYGEVISFFNGSYTGALGEKYTVGASLAEAFINIYTGTRVKVGINWNLFDAEYTVFDWINNSFITEDQNAKEPVKELKSIKAGTRIGPILTVLANKSIAVSIYYSARPGVQFLLDKTYFVAPGGVSSTVYEIEPDYQNFNFSNEIGLKFYFFKRLFISPYIHFGKYNWKSNINDLTTGAAANSQTVQANYDFKYVGLRIGF